MKVMIAKRTATWTSLQSSGLYISIQNHTTKQRSHPLKMPADRKDLHKQHGPMHCYGLMTRIRNIGRIVIPKRIDPAVDNEYPEDSMGQVADVENISRCLMY